MSSLWKKCDVNSDMFKWRKGSCASQRNIKVWSGSLANSVWDTGSLLGLLQPPPSNRMVSFSTAFHINNLRVNAGHCGIFPSLWCLAGACSKSSLTPAGQVSRPHWPDSPGMESVSGRSKSPLWSCSLDHLTQTVQDDNRAQYNRGLKYQKCA